MVLAEAATGSALTVACSEDVQASPRAPRELVLAAEHELGLEVLVLVLDQVELHVAEDLVLVQDRQMVAEVEHAEVEHAEDNLSQSTRQWHQGGHWSLTNDPGSALAGWSGWAGTGSCCGCCDFSIAISRRTFSISSTAACC